MNELHGGRIHISGIVQGVGFRPFVYSLAARLGLTGWVRNTSAGVDIEVDGEPAAIEAFTRGLREGSPPLAVIDQLTFTSQPGRGFTSFEIISSQPLEGAFQPISPDVSVCPDCLGEMRDHSDRRWLYPFTNCTNCGPRFTIITGIPYDRPNTTMASFELCPDCEAEYTDPLDRRFHAQPIACPVCGPRLWLEPDSAGSGDPILEVQRLLAEGRVVAIKGLGGFHLACDAANPRAVALLRERKLRVDKPFALMMPDLETVETHCCTSPAERQLLESRQRPVVILKRRPGSPVAAQVTPRQGTLGVMLPYTPLHYLLFEAQPGSGQPEPVQALVMTSGNLSEEPIATDNEDARRRLAPLADAFLMHDRPIRTRCDDSVLRLVAIPGRHPPPGEGPAGVNPEETGESLQIYRRSRGYAPSPITLPWEAPVILAAGPELKNTFCITREHYAFLSHHIGDLQNYETFQAYLDGIDHFERLFRLKPQAVAHDLHPDYLSTRYALDRAGREGLSCLGIQHHHAHIAACMADNHLPEDRVVIGASFDGTGFGTDGAIWGGEFMLAGYRPAPKMGLPAPGFRRAAHLSYLPLPGGDAAIRRPARTALAYLWAGGLEWDPALECCRSLSPEERTVLRRQLENRLNVPQTSSMGRLFDAVASLAGVRQQVNYEAQAAVELEAAADLHETGWYLFEIRASAGDGDPLQIDPLPVLEQIIQDLSQRCGAPVIAARFHNGLARMVLEVCREIRAQTGLSEVALSGGVWQNALLLAKTVPLLESDRFIVYIHQRVPANDGGLSLGQAVIAAGNLII
jgi:hydrogenase maturation protein HypF